MKTITTICAALLLSTLVLSGCNTKREPGEERATVHAGQQVSGSMVGWVAVPNTSPEVKKDDAKHISYAVLATHNIVPGSLSGWVAINPIFFNKMTDIKIDAPAGNEDKWVLHHEGQSVPRDKEGWAAVPWNEPQIQASVHKKDREMARLATNDLIPKEMNGWVAVDRETLAQITEKYMQTGSGSKVSKE